MSLFSYKNLHQIQRLYNTKSMNDKQEWERRKEDVSGTGGGVELNCTERHTERLREKERDKVKGAGENGLLSCSLHPNGMKYIL